MERLLEIYERWLEIPRWQKWLIIVLFGLILFAINYYVSIKPLQEQLQAKRKQLESLTLEVNRLKVVEKRKAKILKEISKLKKQIREVENKLPTGREEVSKIVKSISDADSGVIVTELKRKTPKSKKYYTAYPYSLNLLTSYPQFLRWCEKLSKAERIINFGPISINSVYGKKVGEKFRGCKENGCSISVHMEIEAFTLKR